MVSPSSLNLADQNAAQGRYDVVIVGTGFAGLAMAARLKRQGVENFIVLEKADSVGGTWRDNHYPGSGCDVPSVLYSFSFAPKVDWSRKYPKQEEIHRYLADTARKFGIDKHIRFGVEVAKNVFDEGEGVWRVTDTTGRTITTRVLVSAVGQLSRPSIPAFPGQDSFKGVQFHSARWKNDFDPKGKRVAVVGNGASAIQFLPQIAPQVDKLFLFQRSPSWVFPKLDRPTNKWERILFKYLPFAQKFIRMKTFMTFEQGYDKYIANTDANKTLQKVGVEIINAAISDPELRKKLTPDYLPGCKRLLISNEWFPALARKNVSVITSSIDRFEADAVVDRDGTRYPVDAVIYATGFKSTQFLTPMTVIGLQGRDLHEEWKDGAEAYRGVSVPGFPNLFLMYGPNTNTHNSIIFMLETQAMYIARKVGAILKKPGTYINLKVQALREYYKYLEPKFARFAWMGDCGNWYLVASGKPVTNWPERSRVYRALLQQSDESSYDVVTASGKSAERTGSHPSLQQRDTASLHKKADASLAS